jgi:hypothetical protein
MSDIIIGTLSFYNASPISGNHSKMGLISILDNIRLISKLMQIGENTHNILTFINTIPHAYSPKVHNF